MRNILASAAAVSIISLTAAMPALADGDASAKSRSVTVMLDGQCDVIKLTYDKKLRLYGTLHTGCTVPGKPIGGIGVVIKHQPPGSSAAFSEPLDNGDGTSTANLYLIGYPFVSGSPWYVYQTKDGVKVGLVASGTYTVAK